MPTRKKREKRGKKIEVIRVTLLPLGGEEKTVVLKRGATIEEALTAGGLDWEDDTEVRLNGEVLDDPEYIVEDGEEFIIISAGKVAGGEEEEEEEEEEKKPEKAEEEEK